MKLIHITQYFHPNKGYQENQFALYHSQIFDEVYIITSDKFQQWGKISKNEMKDLDNDFYNSTGVKIIRLKTWLYIFDRTFSIGLTKILDKIMPSYVYIHSLSSPLTVKAINWLGANKQRYNIKAYIDCHMVFAASSNKLSSLFYYVYNYYFFRKSHLIFEKIIAVSEETKDFIINRFGKYYENKIDVVPLGVDLSVFNFDISKRDMIRSNLKVSPEEQLIIYTGKRDQFKNPKILVIALNKLLIKGEKFKLLFVGDNVENYDNKIQDLIQKYNIPIEKIIIKKSVKNIDLAKYYCAADVAIWPNQASMSMLEAMACKCPVIASNIKVNRERLENNRGVLFKNGNIEDLINSIIYTIKNKEIIKENAYKWIQNYDWKVLAYKSIDIEIDEIITN